MTRTPPMFRNDQPLGRVIQGPTLRRLRDAELDGGACSNDHRQANYIDEANGKYLCGVCARRHYEWAQLRADEDHWKTEGGA